MSDFTPQKSDKFTFGLWTFGNSSRDPFGEHAEPTLSTASAVEKLAAFGAYGVSLQDALAPIDATPAERDRIVTEFRQAIADRSGRAFTATGRFFDPGLKDGAFTANDPTVRALPVLMMADLGMHHALTHAVTLATDAGKLVHIDPKGQGIDRYDQDFRFAQEDLRERERTGGNERINGIGGAGAGVYDWRHYSMTSSTFLPRPSHAEARRGKPSTADRQKKECFVIMPIGQDGSNTRDRSDTVLECIILPAVRRFRYHTIRADLMRKPGLITQQILDHLHNADLVIADLTDQNSNVLYELGVRHEVGKPVLHLIHSSQPLPFDVAMYRAILYDHQDLRSAAKAIREIADQIRSFGHLAEHTVSGGTVPE